MYVYKFVENAEENNKLNEKEVLESILKWFNNPCFVSMDIDILKKGYFKNLGWCYNLKNDLKTFWVKNDFGEIHEYYAPNKTTLRKALNKLESVYKLKIIEVK